MSDLFGGIWEGMGDVARGIGGGAHAIDEALIRPTWEGLGDVARTGGRAIDETLINPLVQTTVGGTKTLTGVDLSGEAKQSVIQQAMNQMGQAQGSLFGGLASGIGIDPKMLMLILVVGGGAVLLLFLLK